MSQDLSNLPIIICKRILPSTLLSKNQQVPFKNIFNTKAVKNKMKGSCDTEANTKAYLCQGHSVCHRGIRTAPPVFTGFSPYSKMVAFFKLS